jgi:glycosyltransferase involved in cell wall biosynthesis
MTTTLLILTWNEIDGMRAVLPQIQRQWVNQILVMDGGSSDGTVEFAKSLGLEVLRQKGKGLRKAYEEAWPHITGDWVITFAPDGSSVVDRIPVLIEKMHEGYDMVIASRYREGAKSEDDDWLTAFGNWMFTTSINLCFGGHYTDSMVMFRIYRRELALKLNIFDDSAYQPMERWFRTATGCEPLLSMRAAKNKFRVGEIPSDEPKRVGGVRKLQPFRWGMVHLIQIARELFSRSNPSS